MWVVYSYTSYRVTSVLMLHEPVLVCHIHTEHLDHSHTAASPAVRDQANNQMTNLVSGCPALPPDPKSESH